MSENQQNSFERLKRYRVTDDTLAEAKENHATECLVACLRFSEAIRTEFIRFLLRERSDSGSSESTVGAEEISTQVPFDDGGVRGFLDLVIERDPLPALLVEVKVGSPERPGQLGGYQSWAKKRERQHDKFLLVRDQKPDGEVEPCGFKRRLWRDWAARLRKAELTGTDERLAKELLEYLEREGITVNIEVEWLKDYAAGIKARSALELVFKSVADRFSREGLSAKATYPEKGWPLLQLGRESWKSKLGGGSSERINLFFVIPGLWDEDHYAFWVVCRIWDQNYRASWTAVKDKTAEWFTHLSAKGCDWRVRREKRTDGEVNLPAAAITTEPHQIEFWEPADHRHWLAQDDWPKGNIEGLADELVVPLRSLVSIVEGLK